jgi:MFS family permease
VVEALPPSGLRSILTHRRFSLWLGSQFTSNLGYSAWSISILWLAYQISGTILLSALVLFVQYGIYSLTFLTGPFVDRIPDKRTIFLIALPLQAVIAALVGVAVVTGSLSVILLLGAVVVMAVLDDFWWITGNTVPRILVGKENLLRANGLQSALVGGGSLVGYAAGAALLILMGPGGGALLRAAMLVTAAILVVPVRLRAPPTAEQGLLRNFVAGWAILGQGKGRPLLQIGALFAAAGFFLGAPVLLITLFASRDFGGSSYVYSLLFATYMVGAVASGLAVGRANPRRYLGRFLVGAMVAEGVMVVLAVAVLPQLLLSAGAWFLVGLTSSIPATLLYSYLQATAPPEAVGRVVSNLELFQSAASAFGAITLGLLSSTLHPSVLGYGVGLALVGVGIAAVAVPAVRGMRI